MVMKWDKNYLRPVCLVQIFLRKKIRITTILLVPKKESFEEVAVLPKGFFEMCRGRQRGERGGLETRDVIKELIENWRRNVGLLLFFLELKFILQRHWWLKTCDSMSLCYQKTLDAGRPENTWTI